MDEHAFYEARAYELPDHLKKLQSQLPALHLLMQLGWRYLTPEETVGLRDGRMGSVILEPILIDHIRHQCRYPFKGSRHPFTENAIQNAVQALKNFRAIGAIYENERAYDLLCLGTSVPQTVEGETKSFTINYIDWEQPENNIYHCTAEYNVERIGYQKYYRPDMVLFVNGIPLAVIECRGPAHTDPKNPIALAARQLEDYQRKSGIPQLFLYSQLLIALAKDKACYGTNGTRRLFWTAWKEDNLDAPIRELLGKRLKKTETDRLLSEPFADVRQKYLAGLEQGRQVDEQDRLLYALCRPKRLIELAYKFILFDNGTKKIARYHQYFTVHSILSRVLSAPPELPRPGGVVWHTQGSGKSLTMVMLAKSLAKHSDIPNPKVILVTDRIDLDDQICGTFRACGLEPEQAKTGKRLVDLMLDQGRHVVTTVINKFAIAASNRRLKEVGRNTFVLVDEGHRSQYSEQHARMRLALKGACFIAFTGTPLAKSAKKNTFVQFGELFQPAYTIARAVEDKAVVPLLYEARHAVQSVDKEAIDHWFERMTLGSSNAQKAALKIRFSAGRQLSSATQKVRLIAWDVSLHYSTTYQNTGLKGQLVAPDKETAITYKRFMDEFALVHTEVLISSPYVQEGEGGGNATSVSVKAFWQEMMDRYGTEKKYNEQLINAFKRGNRPEIIIVVDKLLTGFDAPPNAVLYLARRLKEHALLQAIARVNRLHEGKEYGLILDYGGLVRDLDKAIDFYDRLASYDWRDLEGTITCVADRVAELPQLLSSVWELFRGIRGSKEPEVYEKYLRDEALRNRFYERFSLFARTHALAFSASSFLETTPLKTISKYKGDFEFFQQLRANVNRRYQEIVDFSEYDLGTRKVINTHVGAGEVQRLCDPIDVLNANHRLRARDDHGKSASAKADMIASATRHVIEQEMTNAPVFFGKLSRLLEETIEEYHAGRLKDLEALKRIKDISTKAVTHTDENILLSLGGNDMARRYYGCVHEPLAAYGKDSEGSGAEIALQIAARLRRHKIRDWRTNLDALNRMRGEIDDILFEIAAQYNLKLSLKEHDAIIDRCIEVAIAHED